MEGRSARFLPPSVLSYFLKQLNKNKRTKRIHLGCVFILVKVKVINMKIADHLDKTTKSKLNGLKDKPRKKHKKKNKYEKLSPGELRELMGANKQTLKRGKGGAYKGK